MKPSKKKTRSVQVGISPAAHEKMVREGFKAKPRLSLRELVNIKNNIPKDL